MAKKKMVCGSGSNAVYGIGIFGALYYYLSSAAGLTEFLIAILKSLLWPAFLVYELLVFLG